MLEQFQQPPVHTKQPSAARAAVPWIQHAQPLHNDLSCDRLPSPKWWPESGASRQGSSDALLGSPLAARQTPGVGAVDAQRVCPRASFTSALACRSPVEAAHPVAVYVLWVCVLLA